MEITFTKSYIKDLKVLPKHIQQAAHEVAIKLHDADSWQDSGVDYKKMKGEKNYYRIRIGDYRIIAKYISPNVTMLLIASRGQVYK